MANIKISELTALTPPDAADLVPVTDSSASQTKRTTVGEIVGIISGDVDVANDGTATISELPVSKLQDGAARQLLQTDAAGTGVEWTSNVDVPGTLDVTGATTLDSTLTVPLGSAASPTLRFSGDANTGVYSPGADQVAISTNGTGRLFVDASGNVGVATASPQFPLDVAGNTRLRNNLTVGNLGVLAATESIFVTGGDRALYLSGATSSPVYLRAGNPAASGNLRDLDLQGSDVRVSTGATTGTSVTERLRITSDGKLGLGTSGPISTFTCASTANSWAGSFGAGISQNQYTGISLGYGPSSQYHKGAIAFIRTDTTNGAGDIAFCLGSTSNATNVAIGDEKVRITSTGRLGVGSSSPGYLLDVRRSSAGDVVAFTGSTDGGRPLKFVSADNGIFLGAQWTRDIGSGSGIHAWAINGTERARIDSSGRLLVGTSSARSNFFPSAGWFPTVQIETATNGGRGLSIVNNRTDNNGPQITLGKANGSAIGSADIVLSGDALGVISFTGADGTNFIQGARIETQVDGTPGANNMPGRLVFSTTADGASSPTERLRITNDGRVLLGTTTGDSGLVVDRTVSRVALGTTAPARIYTGAGTVTDNTTATSGTVAHGTIVSFDNPAIAATNASVTYTRASTLYVDGAPTAGTNVTISNRYGLFVNAGNAVFGENVTVGGAVVPASATASLSLINGTIPSASVVNGVSLYAEDVSASSELKVRDEAGNITTLSPHNFSLIPEGPSEEMSWAFYSERDGKKINVDMLKAIRLLEQLSGEQLVYLSDAS